MTYLLWKRYCGVLFLAVGLLWGHTAYAWTRTVVLADGTKHKFSYSMSLPKKVKNDWVKDVTVAAILDLNRDQENPQVSLGRELGFISRINGVISVKVYDVSNAEAKLIFEEPRLQVNKGVAWQVVTPSISFKDPQMSWACERKDTEHFFKFVLRNSAGETRELYQPSLFSLSGKLEIFKLMGTDQLCQ